MGKVRIKVQIVYRNYKNLHSIYNSLVTDPPKGVNYLIPKQSSNFFTRVGFRFYRMFKKYTLISDLIDRSQSILFSTESSTDADIIEFIQLLPQKIPDRNYLIDVEHAAGLYNFTKPTKSTRKKIVEFLSDEKCKGVICTSQIAIKTFTKYFSENELLNFRNKIYLNYPALPYLVRKNKDQVNNTYLKNNKKLKLLFVGNDVYRKGLHELLEAFSILNNDQLELHIISNASTDLISKYKRENIYYYSPTFTHSEIIKMFFLPSDIFVMPTHFDTFGMVLLDALSCGTPVISTKQFAIPEIIRDDVNGILIESETLYLNHNDEVTTKHYGNKFSEDPEKKVVDQLVRSIDKLYKEPNILNKMRKNTSIDFEDGEKFSIKRRNKTLKEIYNKAIS